MHQSQIAFKRSTPIETYSVCGRRIYVKRDDLFGVPPAPPLAKLRGMRLLLKNHYVCGVRLVGCWDTRISKLGEGLAACCTELPGMGCIVSYPTKKGVPEPDSIKRARGLGAEIFPVPGGRISICFYKARVFVEKQGGVMLPFGFECREAVEGVKKEARKISKEFIRYSTLILCCGSGVTLAGLILGLPVLPRRIIGISSGRSPNNILACLKRNGVIVPKCLEIHEATIPYSEPVHCHCPFPAHPNYDLKAWQYMVDNLKAINGEILFWNIGA
jgi:1-aminocyclopropane-1-carboxylate deaminase/D-cysteine desulfhydrase-like pyridoxal-dependent ACC family enzyme